MPSVWLTQKVSLFQGHGGQFDHGTVNCSDVAPPFNTTCNTGAARWMATRSPAAAEWASRWPEMLRIDEEYPGTPAFNLCAPLAPALCRVALSAKREPRGLRFPPRAGRAGRALGCLRIARVPRVDPRDRMQSC